MNQVTFYFLTNLIEQGSKNGSSDKAKDNAFDKNIYGDANQYLDYIEDETDETNSGNQMIQKNQRLAGFTGSKEFIEEMKKEGNHEDPMKGFGHKKIIEREDKYHQRRHGQMLSPDRSDPFQTQIAPSNKNKASILPQKRSYYDVMSEQQLDNEKHDVMRKVNQIEEEKKRSIQQESNKRQKFEDSTSTANVTIKSYQQPSEWDKKEAGPINKATIQQNRVSTKWDTPRRTPGMDGQTPKRNRWDLTPNSQLKSGQTSAETSTPSRFGKGFGETPTPGRWTTQPTPMRMMQETPTPGQN